MKRTALALLVLLLLTSSSRESFAADPLEDFPDPAAAQNLFVEAHALIDKSRYSEACPKLEESLRLVPATGTQLDLAYCNEQIGKIATAWTGFLEVASQAKAANQTERERVARKRARALEARLPKLVIEVPNASQGLEVKRDGIAVDAAKWGTAIPVDPGTHRVTATTPGKKRWLTTVQSTEGTTTRVEVPQELAATIDADAPAPAPSPTDLLATPIAPAAPAPAAVTPADASANAPPAAIGPVESAAKTSSAATREDFPPPVLEEPGTKRRTIAWIVAGVGALGLGVGTGFGLASIESREDSRSRCVGDICDATGVSLRDDAIRNGNIATVSTVVGAAVLVGGLVLMLTAPKRFEKR